MTLPVDDYYFDTCTLSNFAVVNRVSILRQLYGQAAKVTETVWHELRQGLRKQPELSNILLLKESIGAVEVMVSEVEIDEIELMRRRLGGSIGKPTEHLGEAEPIWLIANREIGATVVADDRSAAIFAQQRGLRTSSTPEILASAFEAGHVGCPEAYEILVSMKADYGRGVIVPADHTALC